MRKKFIKTAILILVLLACGGGFLSYRSFHLDRAWIVSSPANPAWAVDLLAGGFTDISVDFRVHDLAASPFQPRYVCDLYWEGRHLPDEIHWSRDGTVAAVTTTFEGRAGAFYGCAYDFREHQVLRTGFPGSPLQPSEEFTTAIERLLVSRGGAGSIFQIPDLPKLQ